MSYYDHGKTNHDQTGVENLSKKGHLAHGVVEAANFELAHLEYNKLTQEICDVLLERNDSGLEMLKFVANYFPLLSVLGAGQP